MVVVVVVTLEEKTPVDLLTSVKILIVHRKNSMKMQEVIKKGEESAGICLLN